MRSADIKVAREWHLGGTPVALMVASGIVDVAPLPWHQPGTRLPPGRGPRGRAPGTGVAAWGRSGWRVLAGFVQVIRSCDSFGTKVALR